MLGPLEVNCPGGPTVGPETVGCFEELSVLVGPVGSGPVGPGVLLELGCEVDVGGLLVLLILDPGGPAVDPETGGVEEPSVLVGPVGSVGPEGPGVLFELGCVVV